MYLCFVGLSEGEEGSGTVEFCGFFMSALRLILYLLLLNWDMHLTKVETTFFSQSVFVGLA